MTHQLNIFLLLFGALQGALLGFWFLKGNLRNPANIYLSIFLMTVGLQLTFKVLSKVWLMENVLIPYLLSYKLPYLIGPLIYLYANANIEKAWRVRDLLHFLPFIFFSCMQFFWGGPQFHMYTQAFFQLTLLGLYAHMVWRVGDTFLKQFTIWVVIAESIIIITLAVMYMYHRQFPDVRLLFIVLTLLIYWISYKVMSNPGSFIRTNAQVLALRPQRNSKYAHSSLKSDEAGRIEKELADLMRQKIFINAHLTIDMVAAKIRTSRHHLSQVINERLGKTYADYINDLKLDEASRRLCNSFDNRFTIAAIALESGFSSVSSFNELFKKRFNTTPSRFRDQHQKKMSA